MGLVQNTRFLLAFTKFTDSLEKNGMKQFWPSLVALLGGAASIFTPQIAAFWAHHQSAAVITASIYMVFAHFMPSPLQATPVADTKSNDGGY